MDFKPRIEIIKKSGQEIKNEIREKMFGYVITALGLVAGLAWNEAIKALIDYAFPLNQNSLLAKFIYAVLITIAIVIITIYLAKLVKKNED